MRVAWIALLFCVSTSKTNAQLVFKISEFLDIQRKLLLDVQPEIDTSCVIRRSTHTLIMCPTEVNCYVRVYAKDKNVWIPSQFNHGVPPWFNQYADCEAIDNESLVGSKWRQLEAVLQVLRTSMESACEFSSVETLNVYESGLANVGRVGGVNCEMDSASDDVSGCPYKLKYLNLALNKVKYLLRHSFCQFRQLEYLDMTNCSLRHVEADAFVDLVRLKEISLNENQLTTLPVNLFRQNTHLQMVDLCFNQLQSGALHALVLVDSLQHLFLSFNQITFVDDRLTFPSTLIRLHVDVNLIQEIGIELTNLTHLTELVISNNNISRVREKAFHNLTSVTFINLEDNKLEQLHEDTFKNNLKLKTLYLNGNKLSDFPPIAHLTNLKVLELSNNRISTIRKLDLINCTKLSSIDLSNNKLSFIEEGSFQNIKQLETLFLTHNRLTEWSADFKSSNILTLDLQFNNFTAFTYEILPHNVTTLRMSSNQIQTIKPYNFIGHGGKEWNLTLLDLSDNRIRSIENLTLPPSIQTIDLSDNQIGQIFSLDDVKAQSLNRMRSINLQNNNVSIICQSLFQEFGSRQAIKYYISGNPLKCSCENLWLGYPQVYLTVADLNEVNCFHTNAYNGFNATTQLFNLVSHYFLCHSDRVTTDRYECPPVDSGYCEMPCPTNCNNFRKKSIKPSIPTPHIPITPDEVQHLFPKVYFMCNDTHLTHDPKDVKLLSFNDDDASINTVSHVSTNDFDDLPENSTFLNLSSSNISSIDENDFDNMTNLSGLSLEHNNFKTLPDRLFDKFSDLTHLFLSNNRLTHLADNTFSPLVNLQQLYLHNNSLTHLPLDQIARLNSLVNISLHDNPWSCDCSFIESFKEFLKNSSKKMDSAFPLNCTKDGMQFSILNFNMDDCFVRNNQLNQNILTISLVFAAILIIIAGLVFRWRYELQVLVYSRYGLRMLPWRRPDEDVNDKQYDAFIAYNSVDMEFVANELVPGLEVIDNPYRLCIYQRHFPGGAPIDSCILEAVRRSSRTLIVLSENFVRSGWCRLEFKVAHVQMLKDQCPRVLVIVVGEVPQTLEPEMELYLKTNTYLKWGERLFWQKLYYAMPDRRVTSPPTHMITMRDL